MSNLNARRISSDKAQHMRNLLPLLLGSGFALVPLLSPTVAHFLTFEDALSPLSAVLWAASLGPIIALLCGSTLSRYFSILFGGTIGSLLSFHLSDREILLIPAGFLAGAVISFFISDYSRRARLWAAKAAGSMVLISTLSVWMFTTDWRWESLLYFGFILASYGALLGAVGGALSERYYARNARTKE